MKNRRGPYTGVEVPEFYPMVEELFTPQEAEVNNVMPRKPVTAAEIAAEMGRDESEIKAILEAMADKGLCRTYRLDDVRFYQAEPFMPGIFEYQFMSGKATDRDRKCNRCPRFPVVAET